MAAAAALAAGRAAAAALGEGVIRLPRPDDFHLHLRDGPGLESLMRLWPGVFGRALIMPNLKPPVTRTDQALAYRARILAALPADAPPFEPLMTLYLTDETTPAEIAAAVASGVVKAVKLYPAGATTNSDAGVTDISRAYPALAEMERLGLPLCVHGEVTSPDVDVFEREPVFVASILAPLVERFPRLKVVAEHITTREAAEFVTAAGPNVAATITPQHLLYNRNALFEGGLRPHRYCLPILKAEADRRALLAAVASGSPKFFLGTDSAPHTRASKECPCGAAGMYTAHAALELYALAFAEAGCLPTLRAFACERGAAFYGLPPPPASAEEAAAAAGGGGGGPFYSVTLRPEPWTVPEGYSFGGGGDVVVPAMAGEVLPWRAVVERDAPLG